MGKSKEPKILIKSQFELLDDSLRSELMMIPEQAADDLSSENVKLSPFMQSLCVPQQINFMQEYLWHIHGEQLEELAVGKRICSPDTFYLKIPHHAKVPLTLWIQKKPVTKKVFIGFKWKWTPVSIDGRWSAMVDEVGYSCFITKFWNK